MAKKVTIADIAPAHVNGLRSAIHALEVQVTILKQMLGGDPEETESEESDSEDTEEEEAPATKGKKGKGGRPAKKAKDEDAEEEESEEEEEEEEAEEEEEEEAEEEEEEEEGDDDARLEVVTAMQKHAGKNGRAAAIGILKKIGKVKSVDDLKPELFKKVIKALR